MSDIHLGESFYNDKKDLVRVRIFFHVPNTKVSNSYPGLTESLDNAGNPIPVSVAPGVTAQELIDLKSGDSCEVQKTRLFDLADGKNAIEIEIQRMWQSAVDDEQARLDKEYPFYGTTLTRI